MHVAKTGGNSIQDALFPFCDDKRTTRRDQDGIERFGVYSKRFDLKKHATLQQYRDTMGDEIFRPLVKFAVARNPWERMISHYFSPHLVARFGRDPENRALDKAQFLAMTRAEPSICQYIDSYSDLRGKEDRISADHIIRFEHLADDFAMVAEKIGLPQLSLPHRNRSHIRSYQEYYDDDLRRIVAARYGDDIERFSYQYGDDI